MLVDISGFDKDQLAEYALTLTPPVELDLSRRLDFLIKDVLKLQAVVVAEPASVAPVSQVVTHIKNKSTGNVFPWSELLVKHLGDNAMSCDADGNKV